MKQIIIKGLIFILPFIVITSIYFICDPFKVIYQYYSYYDYGKPPLIALNRDYVSTETLIRNYKKENYDSFIFGNSRSVCYEVSTWQKYIRASNYYHFDASQESLYGIYLKIKLLNKLKVKINNALLVLDYETLDQVEDSKGHLIIKDPKLTSNSTLKFQMEMFKCFFHYSFLKSFFLLKLFHDENSDLLDLRPVFYNLEHNEIKFSSLENQISRDSQNYYNPQRVSLFCNRNKVQEYYPRVIKETQKNMLQEIRKIFASNKTNFRLVISPLYNQIKINPGDLDSLKKIFGPENIFDFSGKNSLTENYRNYYEPSHYRPVVAEKIMAQIYTNGN